MAAIVNEIDKALQATFPRYSVATGVSNFTWVMYGTSSTGAGITSNPAGMTYIGFAVNQATATPSTNPGDYTWSLIKGIDGVSSYSATIYLQQTAQPSAPTGGTYNFSNSTLTAPSGWSVSRPAISTTPTWAATYNFSTTTIGSTVTAATWSAPVNVGQSATAGSGTPGSQLMTVYLYQWGSVTPSTPAGTSTLTWVTGANTSYTASDGWAVTVPANPGTPGWRLYVATVTVTAAGGTTTSTVSYSSASVAAWAQNGSNGSPGAPGVKSTTVTAYQWGLSAPTTSGTATYTWAAGTYDNPPANGWTANKTNAPGSGYTLYEASVRLTDTSGATTSSVDWTTAHVAGIAFVSSGGGSGSQGASAKRSYVLVDGYSLNVSPTTSTVSGTGYPATGTWGETRAWQSTPPTPVAGQSVFQADGIFDPVANTTVWNVPYQATGKFGSLSAITANLGTITAGDVHGVSFHAGAIRSYAWPAGGQGLGGFYLGQEGLILGNKNDGHYFSVDANGQVTSPQFSIIDGAATFSGALSAPTGTLGSLKLVSNGGISAGSYNGYANPPSGQGGAYFGPEGIALGNYGDGSYLLLYPNGNIDAPGFNLTNKQLTLTSPVIVSPQISSPTVSNQVITDSYTAVISGSAGGSGPNGSRSYGTLTASPTGGRAPYAYSWSLSNYGSSGQVVGTMTITDPTQQSVSFGGSGTNATLDYRVTCVVTDANGRTVTLNTRVTANHGTPQ